MLKAKFGAVCTWTLLLLLFSVADFWLKTKPTLNFQNVNEPLTPTVVIDAGHGGEDGGAISCTGIPESRINLEIAIALNDFMHLIGYKTTMIRTTDTAIYTKGNTLSEKKASDLKERVRIINQTENAILISIHQNHYSDSRYSGAQVFYAPTNGSKELAQNIQHTFLQTINPKSQRQIKQADGIYLMQHISCPGILVECGFLSNYEEESMLLDPHYQQYICVIIGTVLSKCMKEPSIT